MKFTVNSKVLERKLSKVYPAVTTKSSITELENFLIEIKNGVLTVTASDMEIFLKSSMNVDTDGELVAVVKAKQLLDVVRGLDDIQLTIEYERDSRLIINYEKGKYTVPCESSNAYPSTVAVEEEKEIEIEGAFLREAFAQTSFAISKESIRPSMMGLLIEFSLDGIRFVATDGHRMVRFTDKSRTFSTSEGKILPEKAVNTFGKLLSDGLINISFGLSTITFKSEELEMRSRLINQKFPDYNSVIPVDYNFSMKVNRQEFHSAVKRMMPFVSNDINQIKLDIGKDFVVVSASDTEKGFEGTERVNCEFTGDSLVIAFKGQYLNEVLSHLNHDSILLKLISPSKACTIEPEVQQESQDLLILLMPIRTVN